jgi:hypothetical protein
MIARSPELACALVAFQVLQALVASAFLALVLWHDKRSGARRWQVRGDPA